MSDDVKPKRPRGRPTGYRPEYCDLLVEHMAEGASITSFAAEIDVSRSTITEWTYIYPEFHAAVKRGKAKCAAWWERVGRTNAVTGNGNATLVIFGLKNMGPEDWRDKQELAHTSPDGSMTPTRIEIVAPEEGDDGAKD